MYSVGVILEVTTENAVTALIVRCTDNEGNTNINFNKLNLVDIAERCTTISFVVGTITNMLLEHNIPHNLLITANETYIFPR